MGKTKTQLTHTRGEDGGRELLPTEVNRSVGPATSELKGHVGPRPHHTRSATSASTSSPAKHRLFVIKSVLLLM